MLLEDRKENTYDIIGRKHGKNKEVRDRSRIEEHISDIESKSQVSGYNSQGNYGS